MKRGLPFIFAFVCLISMINVSQTVALADEVNQTNASCFREENFAYYSVPHQYAYQLTQEQLTDSTDALIQTILDYPYIIDLFSSNSSQVDAYSSLRKSFNGFAELESRPDAASALLSELIGMVELGGETDPSKIACLQVLLAIPIFSNKLSAQEQTRYVQISENSKAVLLNDEEPYVTSTYINTDIAFTVNGFSYICADDSASTTSGATVNLYTALSDFDDDVKVSNAENTANAYGINLLGYATSQYNCHSYAWYHTSTSNQYWIADISPYVNDVHCTASNIASLGAVAVYLNSSNQLVHSAIVTSVDGDNVVCKSKWSANGLFEHHIANVPSSYRYTDSTVRVVFLTYTRYHPSTITIDNSATHTRTCNVCDWTVTEAHIASSSTGRCIVCGMKGPFISFQATIPEVCERDDDGLDK